MGNFACILSSADFFQNLLFREKIQEYHRCQIVWFQISPDVSSGLIWMPTVCKGNQQATLAGRVIGALSASIYSGARDFYSAPYNSIYPEPV